MISCISLNPSIDRTQHVEKLNVGGLNRIKYQIDAAAGKGVNVALTCAALGETTECVGFMFKEGASRFDERLNAGGVSSDFIMCDGAVRVNTKVLDLEKGEITEFNTSGTAVTDSQLSAMAALVSRHANNADFVVLSGSTPPGCPVDYYRTLGMAAKDAGARVILDADGERLRAGLEAAPFLIKPNRYELELLTGHILSSESEVLDAAMACIVRGVKVVVVSLGADGAIITDGKEAWRARVPKTEIVSTVAAGDTMIAALACAFTKQYDLRNAILMASAAATVRCATDPNKVIDPARCEAMREAIKLEKLL